MHVPDGFLNLPTSAATAVVSASAVTLAVRRSSKELQQSGAPLAGLTAVFVFAAQMINFPVGAGTSGHLLGGTLAAVLVGPWTALLVMTVVLGVQGLFFADGGLTALGTNILLMGIVPIVVGYTIARVLTRVAPPRRGFVAAAAGIGALVSVPTAALAFSFLFSAGGSVGIPIGKLVAAMVGWHTIIGVGEALITAAVVSAVLATRPDLVHLARERGLTRLTVGAAPAAVPASSTSKRRWWVAAVTLPVLIAGGLSMFASSHPDGLEYVGGLLGFEDAGKDSATAGSVLADYGISGWDSPWATGVAGIIGLALVAGLAFFATAMIARRRAPAGERQLEPTGR